MPPKKSAIPLRLTRATTRSRLNASPAPSTDLSKSNRASRIQSATSSPNTSFSLTRLNINDDDDDDDDDGQESNNENDVKEEVDDDKDFLPSTVLTPSIVALGKRRMVESPASSRSTRRKLKLDSSEDESKVESVPDSDSPDPSAASSKTFPAINARQSRTSSTPSVEKAKAPAASSSLSSSTSEKPSRAASVKSSAAASVNDEADSDGSGSEPSGYEAPYERVRSQLLDFHPELWEVWDDLDKVGVQEPEEAEQPEGLKLKLLPFQREGLSWMRKQENTLFKGGVLADEMGMGKTIQMIALLLSEPGKPNLIVAPTVAIIQWMNEIKNHAPSLKVIIFHGPHRTESMKELIKHDVVITTYAIIESGFRKQKFGLKQKGMTVKEDSLLHRIKWHRVILDEAHNIKERSCNTARAAFALEAERRWSLSGTPMQNRVGELYSLIRFMQADPYGYYFCKKCSCKSLHWKYSNLKDCDDCGHRPMDHVCWWNNEILKPIQNSGSQGEGEESFRKLRKLLDRIMLRRTKVERANDLGLPPRKMTVSRYLFNEEEEDLYESLFSDTKRKFSTYVEQGTVLNNYANIFELLTKMRQMVDHPDLVLKKVKPGEVGLPETLVCSICQEEAEDPIVSKCHHLFCREDADQYISSSSVEAPECPVCHIPLSIDLQQPMYIKKDADNDNDAVKHRNFARTSIVNRINMDTWRSSTKIEALVEHLYKLQSEDRSTKSICFSQFVTFLDLIKWRLEKAGFKCVKLDGHMTPPQRNASIKKFSEDPTITVFLISLKAGGVALNLTAASRVFICDPWWNPAAELQAMDRIHRIGQHRPILITRLIIENSIESRILQLQEKKQAMVDSTIGKDPAALARLTPEDLRFLFVN
ncbi:DNA repair protein rad16 [Modicella reniformis]|uniref:DNA repair protein rad16 n=1 Tax=Modicella reniformis TaxID=1440133 RepID=A0A9P6M0T9_9FUNG|nr:DNA repair protein rad16 [Modicella reniformis]